jgi:hypothetical protein
MPIARQIAKMRRMSARNNASVAPLKANVKPLEETNEGLNPVDSQVESQVNSESKVDGDTRSPVLPEVAIENPSPRSHEVVPTGGASKLVDPLTSFLLNMMFVALFYFVATKIFTFYGIGTEAYGIYFTFYLFLYLTTLLLPTEYAKI